jgi:hypothetical protein
MKSLALALCAAAGLSACGSDDISAAGDYALTITNRANGCGLPSWTVDATSNVMVTLTQDDANVTAIVTGAAGFALDLGFGSHSYSGKVRGGDLDLRLFGTRSNTMGNCTYTLNSEIRALLTGDMLAGEIDYTSATNGNPDCGGIENCISRQDLGGTRAAP